MSEQIKSLFLGDLGEKLVAWHLRSKYKINVAIVKGKGIDLLCRDKTGALFPEDQYVGISVKTRYREKGRISKTTEAKWETTKNACVDWNAIPYLSYVRIIPECGTITVFLVNVIEGEKWGKKLSVRQAEKFGKQLFEMKFQPYERYPDW